MRFLRRFDRTRPRDGIVVLTAALLLLVVSANQMTEILRVAYTKQISSEILDRTGALLERAPNGKGHYQTRGGGSPRLRELVVLKEDRFFYHHPGVNPLSIARSLWRGVAYGERVGGSTVTQQLVKNLLGNENNRTLGNKVVETLFALALEANTKKAEILTMYLESAYFGRQLAGIEGASQYYFGKPTAELSDGEIVRLLALLSAPSFEPGSAGNSERARNLGRRLGVTDIPAYEGVPRAIREVKKDPAMFELSALFTPSDCTSVCTLSVDSELTAKIRELVRDRLNTKQFASVANAAVAVIKVGWENEPNELLALVGSPDPHSVGSGNQINMAVEPRPIGSTWKPFIYGKALEAGARPYTLIDDAEYRYDIGTGYAFYPKNYDGIYHGEVTLHYALANSLNVPAVRALEWVGVDAFGNFLTETLGLSPRQSIDTYQLSIALGGLEMHPLLLAHYFTAFPRGGILAPLDLLGGVPIELPMTEKLSSSKRIFAATTTELVNAMLADRLLGVEQFGLASNLNLPFAEYAVKTGTSYDYHDSWTVGYTPDVVVVVWIGNSNNKPMDLVSGATGAGKIWHDVMALLHSRGDTVPKAFPADSLVDIPTKEGRSFGLSGDDVEHARLAMSDKGLVLEPHDGDVLRYEAGMAVPLRAKQPLTWRINGVTLGEGEKLFWYPAKKGNYGIQAYEKSGTGAATLHIRVVE